MTIFSCRKVEWINSGSKLNTSSREVAGDMIKMLLPFVSHIMNADKITYKTLIIWVTHELVSELKKLDDYEITNAC